MPTMKVDRIDDQGDRVLLYPSPTGSQIGKYHVIASPTDGRAVQVGDTVEYEPEGMNFGWFKSRKPAAG